MLYNYFKIAFRNLLRHKAFSFINVFGLAIGMACSILIMLWVQDELSYDRFHANADQLYRLTLDANDIQAAVTVAGIAAEVKAQMPEVKNTVRLFNAGHLLEAGDRKFEEKRILYADSTFLKLFTFPLIQGDAKTALRQPDGILLTEAMARKYFGHEVALGKTIRKDNRDVFTVTGILANVPSNSHLQFDFVLPMAFLAKTDADLTDDQWNNYKFFTYVLLDKHVVGSAESLAGLHKRVNKIFHAHPGSTAEMNLKFQPLDRIHLHSNLMADLPGHGSSQYVQIFSVVAIFILTVACINFMNLATARSARRAKEVGLRKVVGAYRYQLVGQFLGESVFISFLALLVAMMLVWTLLPTFNDLTGKALTLDFLNGKRLAGLLGIALLTGLISGSYPALFLSGFRISHVLKGSVKVGSGNVMFRNGLVITQFVVSIVLMVATAVVYNQLQFIKTRNLGFDKENLLYVPMTGDLWGKVAALKTQLQQNPLTQAYAITEGLPTNLASGTSGIQWEGKDPKKEPIFAHIAIDENFLKVFKMKLLSGRSFSREFKADSANYIVNEKALQLMGMKVATAVGKPLTLWEKKGTIVGVVQDFHFKPIQQTIEPLILRLNSGGGFIVIRTQPKQTEATIHALEKICQQLNPAYPFSYNFLDQDLANLYQGEQRMGSLFNVFAGLAIFISCLGLYGLSAFMAEQRTKEIGVRKVLGASVFDIVYLLSTNFTRLLLLAIAVAVPIAWVATNSWLDGFAYRIDVNWIIFLVACLTALLIAGITISYESIKAALANPVKSLRSE
ncbi:MAG: ABC transporter permease [Bacteroidota bacterium]